MDVSVNSIVIPGRFVTIAGEWYDGMGCMLYAVSSTGGLTTGTIRPLDDDTDCPVSDEQWYYDLWFALSGDVGYARKVACGLLSSCRERADDLEDCTDEEVRERISDYADAVEGYNTLSEFEDWIVDDVLLRLEESYELC